MGGLRERRLLKDLRRQKVKQRVELWYLWDYLLLESESDREMADVSIVGAGAEYGAGRGFAGVERAGGSGMG